MANTLNPNYEGNQLSQMIPDDRLIRYTFDNWNFGSDFTGDITKYYNHLAIIKHDFCQSKVCQFCLFWIYSCNKLIIANVGQKCII